MDENTNIFTPCVAFRVAGSPSHTVVQTHERDRKYQAKIIPHS